MVKRIPRVRLGLKDEIKNFLIDWHNFPIDYWWRRRYNVPFGSKQHREMSLIDMSIDYVERVKIESYKNHVEVDEELEKRDERVVEMSQEEIDKDFDKLDLADFN